MLFHTPLLSIIVTKGSVQNYLLPFFILLLLINGCTQEPIILPESCENYLTLYHKTREKAQELTHLSKKDQAYYHKLFKNNFDEERRKLLDQWVDEFSMERECQAEKEELFRLSSEISFLLFAKNITK